MDKEAYEILKKHGWIKMDMPSKYHFLKRLYLRLVIEESKNVLSTPPKSELGYRSNMSEVELEMKRLMLDREGLF